MSQTRRLAAILAADVAGYSRLIGVDEGGTLRQLKAIRAELMDPKIAEHNGRLVKTTGDGLLVEFGSVVDALRCASELQAGMAERNTEIAADRRIEFRIGINVGDVVVEDGDIFRRRRERRSTPGRLGRPRRDLCFGSRRGMPPASSISPSRSYVRRRVPWMRPEDHAHLLEGLRKAGWGH